MTQLRDALPRRIPPMGNDALVSAYLDAKEFVLNKGYDFELEREEQLSRRDIEEQVFLREAAWVILVSGFRESVVRSLFPAISRAFCDWSDARHIARRLPACKATALQVFANTRKIDAIAAVILRVASEGFPSVKESIHESGLSYLVSYPMIGPVSGLHLLKNIGFPVAKPDRHLTRIAASAGFASPHHLCLAIGDITGDNIAIVDTVLWRYATLRKDYLALFSH